MNEEIEMTGFGPNHPVNTKPFEDLRTKFTDALAVDSKFQRDSKFKEVIDIANQRISALMSEVGSYENMIRNAENEIARSEGSTDGTSKLEHSGENDGN